MFSTVSKKFEPSFQNIINVEDSSFIRVSTFNNVDVALVTNFDNAFYNVELISNNSVVFSSNEISITATLTGRDGNLLSNVPLVLRVLTDSTNPSIQRIQAPFAITNNAGIAKFKVNFYLFNFLTKINVCAYPILANDYGSLIPFISSSPPFEKTSNIIQLILSNLTSENINLENERTKELENNTFYSSALNTLKQGLNQYFSDETVNQSVRDKTPSGGSGNSIYSSLNVTNPELQSPYHQDILSTKTLQGFTKIATDRLSTWSTDLLKNVHFESDTSEVGVVNTVLQTVQATFPSLNLSVVPYKKFVSESGKVTATALKSNLADYSQGNEVERNGGTKQFETNQFRVQASTFSSFDSPVINLTSQQQIVQSKFNHTQSDLIQQSSLQSWARAEDTMSQMSSNRIIVTSKCKTDYAANVQEIYGGTVRYQDSLWNQVGQNSQQTVSDVSASTGTGYGSSMNVATNDYNVVSKQGTVKIQAASKVFITGSMTFINSPGGSLGTSLKSFTKIPIPKPYSKVEGNQPGGKVQNNNDTPEAPITIAGPQISNQDVF